MFLLPIGDFPNYNAQRPWTNWCLIAANIVVYLVARGSTHGAAGYDQWLWDWGFISVAPRLETYFSSMFMHAGGWHLAGNMLFLWIFGDNVEGRLGHLGYLFTYVACGLAAVLVYQMMSAGSAIPYVGASGAIFGVQGIYFLAFPGNRVRFLAWFFLIWTFSVRARIVLGIYFVLDFVFLLLRSQAAVDEAQGGVAYAAHVGGFLGGLTLGLVTLRFLPPPRPVAERFVSKRQRPRLQVERGVALLKTGRVEDAQTAFEAVLQEAPQTPEGGVAALHLGMIHHAIHGDAEAARAAFGHATRFHPNVQVRTRLAAELSRDAPRPL